MKTYCVANFDLIEYILHMDKIQAINERSAIFQLITKDLEGDALSSIEELFEQFPEDISPEDLISELHSYEILVNIMEI